MNLATLYLLYQKYDIVSISETLPFLKVFLGIYKFDTYHQSIYNKNADT